MLIKQLLLEEHLKRMKIKNCYDQVANKMKNFDFSPVQTIFFLSNKRGRNW